MNKVIAFVLGAAAGSLITWKLVEKKYKQIADEEIESVIQRFKDRPVYSAGLNIVEPSTEVESVTTTASYVNASSYTMKEEEYNKLLEENGYSTPTPYEPYEPEEDGCVYIEPGVDYVRPYVITPEEFGERDDLDTKTWRYYADFVLTDEEGEIVSDPESIIGDALNHFGKYEEDSVYVRNENIECDYEILKHDKTFSEVNGSEMNV